MTDTSSVNVGKLLNSSLSSSFVKLELENSVNLWGFLRTSMSGIIIAKQYLQFVTEEYDKVFQDARVTENLFYFHADLVFSTLKCTFSYDTFP